MVRIEENAYRILVGKPLLKRSLVISRKRWGTKRWIWGDMLSVD
jgi:hypothetical protein